MESLVKKRDWYKDLTPLQIKLYRQLYKKDFYEFFKEFWDTYEPVKLVDGPLIQFYCELYQYLVRKFIPTTIYSGPLNIPAMSDDVNVIDVREDKRNICLNVPPSHCKSATLNVAAGVWTIINYPTEIASVSHTESLSTEMNEKRQRILNSEKFHFFFPEIALIANSKSKLVTNNHANLYSVNRNAFTGDHALIIVCDDLTNARTAVRDKTELQNAVAFYRDTLPSRLSDPLTGVIMNIQQRLAKNDITGTILEDAGLASQYSFVSLPAEFLKETYVVCPISGTVFHYKVGDFLWPERFGNYEGLKLQVGERVWSTQYQQQPIAASESIIKEDMITEVNPTEIKGWDISNNRIDELEVDRIIGSNDFPFKKSDTSDYLGHVLGYKIKKKLYIVDCVEEKQNFPDSVRFLTNLTNTYPQMINLIESKANGQAIIDALKEEISGLIPFNPGLDSKEDRLSLASTWLISQNVVLVRTHFNEATGEWELSPALQKLKERLLAFPAVTHDDIVDAFSMIILHTFNDIKYNVYGKSFNDLNLVDAKNMEVDYASVFFNKENDNWKVLEIGIKYEEHSKLIVKREEEFKANIEDAIKRMKVLFPSQNCLIDASDNESMVGIFAGDIAIEKYTIHDFDKSISDLNYAFAQKLVLVDNSCRGVLNDLDTFKFSKNNSQNYVSKRDGYLACIRTAMNYFGGIY